MLPAADCLKFIILISYLHNVHLPRVGFRASTFSLDRQSPYQIKYHFSQTVNVSSCNHLGRSCSWQVGRCVQQHKLQTNLLSRVKWTRDDSPGVIITDVFLMILKCFLFRLRLWSEAIGTEPSVTSLSCIMYANHEIQHVLLESSWFQFRSESKILFLPLKKNTLSTFKTSKRHICL